MNKLVTIIDYNVGNILNVARAFKFIGCEVKIVQTATEIGVTDLLVLPGVGSFSSGMLELEKRGFVEYLNEYHRHQKKNLMGICLGMQMLFENSLEHGESKGLGFLAGQVVKIPNQNIQGRKFPVPHVGWKKMQSHQSADKDEGTVYFVHSYFVENAPEEIISTSITYGDVKIPAVVKKDNIIGFQFHPEKSAEYGLALLKKSILSLK
ncbi:MAG: imidazole glycerol phosphate synthase subunit HisH [Bdellovibrionota bacterium]